MLNNFSGIFTKCANLKCETFAIINKRMLSNTF